MAATAMDRNTLARKLERQIVLKLETTSDIPAGAIVCVNAAGNAVNGADAAGLRCMGRAQHRATYAAGERFVETMRGVFCYANDGTIVQADVGTLATVLDNQTVSKAATTANDVGAGYIEEVTGEGVWIAMLGGLVAAA